MANHTEIPHVQRVDQVVVAVVADVLGRDRVSPDDDFFLLGGSSLSAALVSTQLEGRLGLEVPLRLLFENPCIRVFTDKLVDSMNVAAR
ncbi:phosphopantetheine-binding protein [Burkholderia alba]|uniref:phosphopantetheine-binding protein n=1 Tax=Burkholderia alba TaxID=2683677 RepID=UPI002B055080|nr:phosphopantetheine-binding protein [Burkholderia alba]